MQFCATGAAEPGNMTYLVVGYGLSDYRYGLDYFNERILPWVGGADQVWNTDTKFSRTVSASRVPSASPFSKSSPACPMVLVT